MYWPPKYNANVSTGLCNTSLDEMKTKTPHLYLSIYLLSEEVHVLGHVLAALWAGVVWVGHGAALADLDAGGAVQAGQAGQACGAVSRDLENIPFIQIVSRRLKWLWLGMIKGLNWIKIQQVFIGTNRYQDRYSRDISPLDGAQNLGP